MVSDEKVVKTRFTCALCGKAIVVREDKVKELEEALDTIIRAPKTNIAIVVCHDCFSEMKERKEIREISREEIREAIKDFTRAFGDAVKRELKKIKELEEAKE